MEDWIDKSNWIFIHFLLASAGVIWQIGLLSSRQMPLVSEVIEKITHSFTNEHSSLVNQWNQGNDVSTEDLRKALQRYRSFFNRLVV